MNPRDRFTAVTTLGENGVKIIRGVYDHLQQKYLTETEAEKIFYKEYGTAINLKDIYIKKLVSIIEKEVEDYNKSCDRGFEITHNDIINHLKK